MCRAPGAADLFPAFGAEARRRVRATGEGRGPVNEPSLCRLSACEAPSLGHLLLSIVVVFVAVAASFV